MLKPKNTYILHISILSGLITFLPVLSYYKGFTRKELGQLKQSKQLKHGIKNKRI
jgi:hypothetical protein